MHDDQSIQLLDALRAAFITDRIPASFDAGTRLSAPLLRFTEQRAFQLGALVPIEATAARAIGSLVDSQQVVPDDGPTLVAKWETHVDARIQHFIECSEEWDADEVETFLLRCAVVFGVDDRMASDLISKFHQMYETERFGIFVLLMLSPGFDYIKREIDAMPPDVDIAIDDPRESMKALMRSLLQE